MPAYDKNGIPILGRNSEEQAKVNELILQIKQGRAYIQQLEAYCGQLQQSLMNNGNILAFLLHKENNRVRISIDDMKNFVKDNQGKIRSYKDTSTKSIIVELIPLTKEEMEKINESQSENTSPVEQSNSISNDESVKEVSNEEGNKING